jgi:hypothetical protein
MTETAVALREKARSQGYGKAVVPKPAPPPEAPLDRSSFAPQLPEDGVRPAPILSSRTCISTIPPFFPPLTAGAQQGAVVGLHACVHARAQEARDQAWSVASLLCSLPCSLLPATLLTFSPQQEFKHHARASSRPCRGRAQARACPP